MIKPTVGRIVWLNPAANVGSMPGQPHAAIIAGVMSDNMINVAAFDANGHAYSVTGVHLIQDGEEPRNDTFAQWMPYQRGQSANADGALSDAVGVLNSALNSLSQRVVELNDGNAELLARVAALSATKETAADPQSVDVGSVGDSEPSAAPDPEPSVAPA